MGRTPIVPPPRESRLEAVRREYLAGRLDAVQFERVVGDLFVSGREDEPAPVDPRTDLIDEWLRPIR